MAKYLGWENKSQQITGSFVELSPFHLKISFTKGNWNVYLEMIPACNLTSSLDPERLKTPSCCYCCFQLLSCLQLFVTPWTEECQAFLSITISLSLPKLMFIESVMPSNHLILCCPILLLTSIFPSIRVFSNESALPIRWPKYWSFSFSISPSNKYSGLASFRIDWFDLLAVQGTLQVFSSTTVRKCQFFGTQPSLWSNSHIHTYMTTGKTIALTMWTFVGKVVTVF